MSRGSLALPLLLAVLLPSRPSWSAEKPGVLVIRPPLEAPGKLLAAAELELSRSDRFRIIPLAALHPLMRQADETAATRGRAAPLTEEGRQALVALDHHLAQDKLGQALALLEGSFIRHYDPRIPAQVHVLLGVAAVETARPDLARQSFVTALHLDPSLELDAHYSPQVRSTFAEAARNLPPPPAPSAAELRRLLRLGGARVALVLGVEPAGGQTLLSGALFLEEKGAYAGVESRQVDPADAAAVSSAARAVGARLRRLVETRFPAPSRPIVIKKDPLPPKLPPPPPRPWYLRWYTLAGAGLVVSTAIILPLALRGRYVEMTVRW